MARPRVVNFLEYIPLRISVFLIDCLSVNVALSLGRFCGTAAWYVLHKRRKTAISNVLYSGITSDAREARRIAKESFKSFSILAVESLLASKLITPDTVDQYVDFDAPKETFELIENPMLGGIFVSAHIGNWEVSGHIISFKKRLAAVARNLDNPFVQRFMEKRNPRRNIFIVEKHSKDRMALIRPLKTGMMLGLIADQHAASHGVMVDFFGHPASTVTSPARLHLATGCPIIYGYFIRTGKLKFKAICSEPIIYEKTDDKASDIIRITQDINKRLEKVVKDYPEQYLWSHRRWRNMETVK